MISDSILLFASPGNLSGIYFVLLAFAISKSPHTFTYTQAYMKIDLKANLLKVIKRQQKKPNEFRILISNKALKKMKLNQKI